MYTVSCIFSHTANSMKDARAMASTASYDYNVPADIIDNTTGEVVAHYEYGREVTFDWD